MLRELVEKADELEHRGKLNPIGYKRYSDPIAWVVHLYPDEDRIELEEYEGENRPRAQSSRTSGVYPYPFADEASYVLGIKEMPKDKIDKKASKKHQAYLALLDEMAQSEYFQEPLLQEATSTIIKKLTDGSIAETFAIKEIYAKDWITFVYEKDKLRHQHLHEIEATRIFWANKTEQEFCTTERYQCAICGKEKRVALKSPSSIVVMGSNRQLMSFNKNSFVSYRYKQDEAHLGVCQACAEKSTQALDHLVRTQSYTLFEDKPMSGQPKSDSARNQVAVYWLKQDVDFSLEGQSMNLLDLFSVPMSLPTNDEIVTTEELIKKFLKLPSEQSQGAINIDKNTFYLSIISPNGPGRIAVRDWFEVSADKVQESLVNYLDSLRLIGTNGKPSRPYTIYQLLQPLKDTDPNMARALLRSAYLGERPPFSVFQTAIRRLRVTGVRDGSLSSTRKSEHERELAATEVWQRLCSIIKFYLTFGTEEAISMEKLDSSRNISAYQSGRLLAILEDVQRQALGNTLSSTLVDRYYGSASTAPSTVFPLLLGMATKAHMPKVRKNQRGYTYLETLLEDVMSAIDKTGGFKRTLSLLEQGEFALGFYHQRAELKSRFAKNQEEVTADGDVS